MESPYERFNGRFTKQISAFRWRIQQIVCDIDYGGVRLHIDEKVDDQAVPDVTLKYLQEHFMISETNSTTMITMYGSYIRGYRSVMTVGSVHTKFTGVEKAGFVWWKGFISEVF